MLRERSFAHRGGIACRMGEQDLTWEELHSRASALAAKLAEGSGPVLIYGEKSPAYVIAMVGCLWAGRPYVPAGPHYPAQRVSSMVAQANIHTASASSSVYPVRISSSLIEAVIASAS